VEDGNSVRTDTPVGASEDLYRDGENRKGRQETAQTCDHDDTDT